MMRTYAKRLNPNIDVAHSSLIDSRSWREFATHYEKP